VICLQPPKTPEKKAETSPPGEYFFWLDVYKHLPYFSDKPIQCDKVVQMWAKVLAEPIKQRTKELAESIMSDDRIAEKLDFFQQQIDSAVQKDPSRPGRVRWLRSIKELKMWFFGSRNKALMPIPYVNNTAGMGLLNPNLLELMNVTNVELAAMLSDSTAMKEMTQSIMTDPERLQAMYDIVKDEGAFVTGPQMGPNEAIAKMLIGDAVLPDATPTTTGPMPPTSNDQTFGAQQTSMRGAGRPNPTQSVGRPVSSPTVTGSRFTPTTVGGRQRQQTFGRGSSINRVGSRTRG